MPPAVDLIRLVAVVLSVMAGAAILSVIKLHWQAWRSARAHVEPIVPQLWNQWKSWNRLRKLYGCPKRSFIEVLKQNRKTLLKLGESPGLTPFHVWAVSVAHGMLLFAIALGLLDQLGTPGITWRVWIYIVAPFLTLLSLFAIGLAQHRRVRHHVVYEQRITTEIVD